MENDNNKSLVLDLLDYIEQVEKLSIKPVFNVPIEYFCSYQSDLKGLPELHFNLQHDADDVWMRIPRLAEIPAPKLNETLSHWVNIPKSPDENPELKTEIVTYENKKEISREQLKDNPKINELFDWYIENQWTPWSLAEIPRRKTIAIYNKLFSLQQTIASEGAETPLELMWGIGNAVWKKKGVNTTLKYPLILQACEIALNEKTFELEIRPRETEPRIEVECYAAMDIAGVTQLEAFWKASLASNTYRVNPFENSTFEGILKAAVGYLDPKGTYEERVDDVTLPTTSENLKITNTWVLFARKRSRDIFIEDILRLKKAVKEANALPTVITSFVQLGDSSVNIKPEQPFRGLSSSDSPNDAFELYFPMPYNDEQVSIVQKLESNDGVVVQGPPGTGKTHTIANVICHYLAQGKRVLVTAKGESPLAVLQEKLPERIRPLCVALLSDERDGMKQFEHSIQTIASTISAINPTRAGANIRDLNHQLNQIHAKISHLDNLVSEHAGKHMKNYKFMNKEVLPNEMARMVIEQADNYQWFDDEPTSGLNEINYLSDSDISIIRKARLKVGKDLEYINASFPASDEFPAWSDISSLHMDLIKAKSIDTRVNIGNILGLADSSFETYENAIALIKFIDERKALKLQIDSSTTLWLKALKNKFSDTKQNDPALSALFDTCKNALELEARRRELIPLGGEVPLDAELNTEYIQALNRLVTGKNAFKFPIGQAVARKLIASTTVLGSKPSSKDEWELAEQIVQWRNNARKLLAKWTALTVEFGLGHPAHGIESGIKCVLDWQYEIQAASQLVYNYDGHLIARLEEVFGNVPITNITSIDESYVDKAYESLQAHIAKSQLSYAMQRLKELEKKLDGCSGNISQNLREFITLQLGDESIDVSDLRITWFNLQSELTRLNSLKPYLTEISNITTLIQKAGAPKWAHRMRTELPSVDIDPTTPTLWQEAWGWRIAVMQLDDMDGHKELKKLFDERKSLSNILAKTYQDLVAEKTWLGVFNNSPERVRQALQSYLTAVRSIGKGTGTRAVMYRRDARKAMTQAYSAVPCWVLPQWRISEAIPAELGIFHLVVIDEASQSDISALPVLLRGKKILVVGDDKQVSPSAIGLATQQIDDLRKRHLTALPHGELMTPERSIYDLAQVIFAGNSVMLTEHFRCVPAIIEYSNREFYQNKIIALRVPKANERLDPPLVDVFVKGGFRDGHKNHPEAIAIVDEIKSILTDSIYDGKSIGVVTLHGTEQAALIHDLIYQQISPSEIINRKIAIGPPPVFQGRERDIMLISMVHGRGNRSAATKQDMLQRFNVALSRARDRMYLFRSVDENEFEEHTLNGRLISHFKQPFRQNIQKVNALREKCESGFEFEMFDELVRLGYRVFPQVPCGGYRIDFVVEGSEGRRLAIECDGDKYHGPGQWKDDMIRQRVLERAGWTFWRCFASSFVRRRNEVINDLINTLNGLSIDPLGSETVDNTAWVHYKEVDPMGIDNEVEINSENET